MLLARAGLLARLGPRLLTDLERARRRVYSTGYQDVQALPLDVVRSWLTRLLGSRETATRFQRWGRSLHARDLLAAEPAPGRLQAPTLIVWRTGDRFFGPDVGPLVTGDHPRRPPVLPRRATRRAHCRPPPPLAQRVDQPSWPASRPWLR